MENSDSLLCPSYRSEGSTHLLGVRKKDGTIAILPKALETDISFTQNAKQSDVPPEQRFRFAGKCLQSGCKQWTSGGCGVAVKLNYFLSLATDSPTIPECSLRNNCRWYNQEGESICRMCPRVVTDLTAAEIDQYFINKEQTNSR
ncbi:MAG: hypothetical protein JST26_19820 [Bacteroidetes bacterium]|nr:hypothetical protein [Bacteroidota bacterium]